MYLKSAVTTALTLLLATASTASTIPLKAGDYGDISLACDDHPNAGVVSFDGKNFQYPHATRCTDTVTGRTSGLLLISETCRANGDGSPARPTTQMLKVKVKSADRFQKIYGKNFTTYHRCGALGYFNKH